MSVAYIFGDGVDKRVSETTVIEAGYSMVHGGLALISESDLHFPGPHMVILATEKHIPANLETLERVNYDGKVVAVYNNAETAPKKKPKGIDALALRFDEQGRNDVNRRLTEAISEARS